MGIDLIGLDVKCLWPYDDDAGSKHGSDLSGRDVVRPIVEGIVSTKGHIAGGVVPNKGAHTPNESTHRTGERIAAATVGDDLALDAILLSSEGEGGQGSSTELGVGSRTEVSNPYVTDVNPDILQMEGCVVPGEGVFPGA